MNKYIVIGLIVLSAVVSGSIVKSFFPKTDIRALPVWNEAPQIKTVVKIKRINVPGPKEIVTIEKEKIVDKLKLPDEIKLNTNKQILATAEVKPYRGITEAVAIMDTQTGETKMLIKPRPLPFAEFLSESELGVRYGLSTVQGQTGEVFGRWTFGRVTDIYLAVYGEANARPEAKIMMEASYRR